MKTVSFEPFSAKTRHTEAVIEVAGKKSRVVKGALRTVAEAAGLDAGAVAALEKRADEQAQKGVRALAVARADGDGPLRLLGLALLYDAPRPESRSLIDELRSLGIKVLMLTGDALPVAREMARILGLGEIALAPSGTRRRRTHRVWRPISPAEAWRRCSRGQVRRRQEPPGRGSRRGDDGRRRQRRTGAQTGGGRHRGERRHRRRQGRCQRRTDAGGLVNIVDLVKTGRATYQRVLTWIVNKVSRSILKAGFVVIAFLVTGQFVISALVMLLVVCLTDVAHIALATDRVVPSQKPETWNIGPLVRVAVVVGVLTLVETLGCLRLAGAASVSPPTPDCSRPSPSRSSSSSR